MLSSDVIRGHVDTIVLKLLSEKDMYGYELANVIKERTKGVFEIKEATLYSVLQRMESRELIDSYSGEKSYGRKRRYYRLTSLGKAYLKTMVEEWETLKDIMQTILGSDTR